MNIRELMIRRPVENHDSIPPIPPIDSNFAIVPSISDSLFSFLSTNEFDLRIDLKFQTI